MKNKVPKIFNEIDKSNLRKIILEFPKQFRIGIKRAENIQIKNKFKRIFICGIGGSALPGELLKMYFENAKIKIPLFLHQDYQLPHLVEKGDLLVTISYSGNTEETISSFEEALEKKLNLVSITSNGRLSELCRANKIPVAIIPPGIPPRFSLGYLFSALLKILANSKIISPDFNEIFSLENKLNPERLEGQGKKLAEKLKNKIPLIYSSRLNFPLAKIWKIKFNENSKIPAFANFFPELNHNEMVGFANLGSQKLNLKNFYILILKDLTDYPSIIKRMDLTTKILKKKGIKIAEINLEEKKFFPKIFSNLSLADWVSYYLALNYQIDPAPVEIVEEFKKKMKNEK